MNEKFDIAIDRVEKIPVPLLVVGLGGTGCDALQTVKKVFAERYILPTTREGKEIPVPAQTAYLGIDSLNIHPDGLEVNEYVDISLPGMEKILTNQAELLTASERSWVNHDLRHGNGGLGMGTVRQAARLALSRNYSKVRTALQGALNQIVSANVGTVSELVQQYEIVIITGLGGGTGSGIFLDVAQIIRKVAKEVSPLPAKLTAYIVMPDVSLSNVKTVSGMEGPIKHNAYAAMKELDFWMRVKDHETPYSMTYGDGANGGAVIDWKEPPFDNCILMSCSNVKGIPYKNPYGTVCNTIAENLMHYLAAETAAQNQNKYSYRQYEDNLASIPVTRNYPLNYRYRAIGAFTKRIPKKPVLFYEGKILLSTFIPMRDSDGNLQPDRRLFTDGQGEARAAQISSSGQTLLRDFGTNICHLPDFCNTDVRDSNRISAIQDAKIPPHEKWDKWRDSTCSPSALTASENYFKEAWNRFSSFAESVVTNPEQGPFALREYLQNSEGLLKFLRATLLSWKTKYNESHNNGIRNKAAACNNSWHTFCHPPILGRQRALERYIYDLNALYSEVRKCEFLAAYSESLRKLVLRIEEYARDGLKPLCSSLLNLEKTFSEPETDDVVLAQNIYTLNDVQKAIDNAFQEANKENQFSGKFLKLMLDISLDCQAIADQHSSGVEFTCRNMGLLKMCRAIQETLEDTYKSVNDQSLDDIMVENVGEDETLQHKWMDDLATSALNSAYPMFQMDPVFAQEHAAPYSYMSIPQNAKKHVKYISEAFKVHDPAVEPKASTLTDHIYCLMALDKLPLYRYGLMEELRQQYDLDLNGDNAKGLHLVCTGEPDATFAQNWALLPSPKPYFLFPRSGYTPVNEVQTYEHVHSLTQRAIACHMITVHDDQAFVSVDIRVKYASHVALYTSKTMLDQMEAIKKEKNPATGDTYSVSEQAQKISAYRNNCNVVRLQDASVKPSSLAAVIHAENEPCDPYDKQVQGNVNALAKAWENHKKLCVVMAQALIYCRPDVVRAMELQIDAFESMDHFIEGGDNLRKLWEKRSDYAETFANIFIYLNDSIVLNVNGYKYKVKGERYDIVTPTLLAEDLKAIDSDLLKTEGFLADADDQQTAKADLTQQLRVRMKEVETSLNNEEATAEDLQEYIDAAKDLLEEIEDAKVSIDRRIHTNPGEAELLNQQKAVLNAISDNADSLARKFRKLARGLK